MDPVKTATMSNSTDIDQSVKDIGPMESEELVTLDYCKEHEKQNNHWLEIEPIDIIELIIVIICGIALIKSIDVGSSDSTNTIIGGLMGYMGASAKNAITKRIGK